MDTENRNRPEPIWLGLSRVEWASMLGISYVVSLGLLAVLKVFVLGLSTTLIIGGLLFGIAYTGFNILHEGD